MCAPEPQDAFFVRALDDFGRLAMMIAWKPIRLASLVISKTSMSSPAALITLSKKKRVSAAVSAVTKNAL